MKYIQKVVNKLQLHKTKSAKLKDQMEKVRPVGVWE